MPSKRGNRWISANWVTSTATYYCEGDDYPIYTTNNLIDENRGEDQYYPYAVCGKTGFTDQAGKCLVTSIYHNNRNIIIVTLNAPSRWETTEQLYNIVKDEYDFISVDYNEVFKDLKINDNEKKYLNFAVK